jgi:hypothetical protein
LFVRHIAAVLAGISRRSRAPRGTSSSTQELTMKDTLAFAAALGVLLAVGCGRIEYH